MNDDDHDDGVINNNNNDKIVTTNTNNDANNVVPVEIATKSVAQSKKWCNAYHKYVPQQFQFPTFLLQQTTTTAATKCNCLCPSNKAIGMVLWSQLQS